MKSKTGYLAHLSIQIDSLAFASIRLFTDTLRAHRESVAGRAGQRSGPFKFVLGAD